MEEYEYTRLKLTKKIQEVLDRVVEWRLEGRSGWDKNKREIYYKNSGDVETFLLINGGTCEEICKHPKGSWHTEYEYRLITKLIKENK